jgi:hypothetical protein
MTDFSFSQPYFLRLFPFSFVFRRLLISFRTADIFLVKIAEVVAKMVFSSEWILASGAFDIVAREDVFLIGVDVLVVALEICGSAEYVLLGASTWILAGKLVFLETSTHNQCQSSLQDIGVKQTTYKD